jgi:ribonuclease HI
VKTHVAPLKSTSIPRLELQAAVLATRLAETIKGNHDIQFEATHFWSDSKTVLLGIRSDGQKFQQFVAHRVGEIQEFTNVNQWHWVPTKENVTDEATLDGTPCDFNSNCRWLNGPAFLKL